MKLMLNCKEVHDHASDYLAVQTSRRKRLAIWMHIMMCSHCRRFMHQMRLTLAAVRRIGREQASDMKPLADQLYERFLQQHKRN